MRYWKIRFEMPRSYLVTMEFGVSCPNSMVGSSCGVAGEFGELGSGGGVHFAMATGSGVGRSSEISEGRLPGEGRGHGEIPAGGGLMF